MDLQFPYAKNQAKFEKLRCNNFAFAPKLTFLEGLSPVVDQELFSKNVDNEPWRLICKLHIFSLQTLCAKAKKGDTWTLDLDYLY